MASQEMLEAAAAMRAAPALDLDIDDIEALRVSEGDEIEALAAVPEDVSRSDFDAGGVPARHVATPGVRDDRGVLYFHGGGYVAGSLDSHTELMSRIARACRAPVLSGEMLAPMAAAYAGAVDLTDPGVSPLFGDLTGLPPLLIQVGDDEVLRDDSTRLAERAETVGVSVQLHVFEGAFHVFQMFPTLPESSEALAEMGRFFDAVTG